MTTPYLFTSKRLGFRDWKMTDLDDFFAINSCDQVMEFFPSKLTKEETKQYIVRLQNHFKENGHSFYAVELLDNQELIGFIGLAQANMDLDFTPCKEIGWRLKASVWNKGYATEGAKRVLEYGFNDLKIAQILSWTAKINVKSERIMQKIGMHKVKEFMHPKVDAKNRLNPHVLYMIVGVHKIEAV